MALKFNMEDCFLCLSLRCKVRKSRVKEGTAPKNSCQPVGCHGAPLGVVKRKRAYVTGGVESSRELAVKSVWNLLPGLTEGKTYTIPGLQPPQPASPILSQGLSRSALPSRGERDSATASLLHPKVRKIRLSEYSTRSPNKTHRPSASRSETGEGGELRFPAQEKGPESGGDTESASLTLA
ncbi:Linear gramicidin synthase subunit C [Dissostichus eleginoides]|uniref:Linear gramicidin synthase subunit C n=1 Tax=Dissostichus eleginoides TaxID=100907 RepID=A0AAD9FAN7_DISEL|nr:Linear gramicidin synthase subunit C [Dissostichus eleginoides]